MKGIDIYSFYTSLEEFAEETESSDLGFYSELNDSTFHAFQEGLGLLLLEDPERWDYYCTPLNALTFANTGGDGTHFSVLILEDEDPEDGPIVMTVPMANVKNIILGDSLHEFLRLGSRYGYFALDQLAYDYEETVAQISASFKEELPDIARKFIKKFKLTPWKNVDKRLQELQTQYLPKLILPDNEE